MCAGDAACSRSASQICAYADGLSSLIASRQRRNVAMEGAMMQQLLLSLYEGYASSWGQRVRAAHLRIAENLRCW